MRLRSGLTVLAICLPLGQGAIALLPGVASAEWKEETWPCDVAPWGTLPQPVTWFQVGEPALLPMGYFTYGVPTEEAPPTSDFTAIANWGDGATSPATVEEPVGDCYEVATPSHTYATTGAYPFSYTLHDMKTGLDHTLGATELHIWSEIPRLLGSSSSGTIDATVGAPWTGVVGEFSSETNVNSSYPYIAQIEWGDGEPSTSGTINPKSDEHTFTVSGSFTYAHPFSGTISVLLWHGAQLLGKWTTSRIMVNGAATADLVPPAHVRLRGQPILAAIPRPAAGPVYELVFRTSRLLPQTNSGHVDALIETHGRSNPIGHLIAHRNSTCYVALTRGIGKRKLKLGARYPFSLTVDEDSVTRASGHAALRQFASLGRMRSVTSRQLGCT